MQVRLATIVRRPFMPHFLMTHKELGALNMGQSLPAEVDVAFFVDALPPGIHLERALWCGGVQWLHAGGVAAHFPKRPLLCNLHWQTSSDATIPPIKPLFHISRLQP